MILDRKTFTSTILHRESQLSLSLSDIELKIHSGWMMFQYLVSGLATGAAIALYEGSPLKRPALLWEMVDDLGITILGTSAKWIEQISVSYLLGRIES